MIRSRRQFAKVVLAFSSARVKCAFAGAGTPERATRFPTPTISEAQRLSSLCSPSSPSGVGLFGEYFGQANFLGRPLLTRVDGVIDFDASLDWPVSIHSPQVRSVRWSGWVRTPLAGRYLFHLAAKNSRVTVSRQALAENGISANEGIDLVAGNYYPIAVSIDSFPLSFESVRLEWTAPYGARYVVPKALLHLPTDTTSPAKS